MCSKLVSDVSSVINENTSSFITNHNKKEQLVPWLNDSLKKLIKVKEKLRKKCKKYPYNLSLIDNFNRINKIVKSSVKISKHRYYSECLKKCNSNQEKIWKFLNRITGRYKEQKVNCINNEHGIKETDPAQIVKAFVDYFTNTNSTAGSIPNINFFGTLNTSFNEFNFLLSTETEVLNIIREMNNKRSVSCDNIPIIIIKNNLDIFPIVLSNLFNKIITEKYYPIDLKTSKVIPVHKKGCKLTVSNYRPISIPPTFAKIFEKMLYNRIDNHLASNHFLYPYQYGFQKGVGTQNALTDVVEIICQNLESNKMAAGLFLDLKKAFDSLDHDILLHKLNSIGFTESSLSLIESYLKNRQQYVNINDIVSEKKSITVGVPQGSTLGPLLFLIYINDIHKLPLIGKLVLYADDCSIFYADNDIYSLECKIEHDLVILIEFFRLNKIDINFSKTKLVNFRSLRYTPSRNLNIKIGDITLHEEESVRFLGIDFDRYLKWHFQVNSLVSRLSALNGLLFKFKYRIPKGVKLDLYFALAHSIISYCAGIWACNNNVDKIQVCQNKLLKNVFNLPIRHSTFDLYYTNKILPIKSIYKYQQILSIFKIKNGIGNVNIDLDNYTHQFNTRNRNNIRVQRHKTLQTSQRISVKGSEMYNALPNEIKNISNYVSFKKALKNHLLTSAELNAALSS